jgi:hypothetical protein
MKDGKMYWGEKVASKSSQTMKFRDARWRLDAGSDKCLGNFRD